MAGALNVEDGSFSSLGDVAFVRNRGAVAGGAIAGSSQSSVKISGNSTYFADNSAGKVCCIPAKLFLCVVSL